MMEGWNGKKVIMPEWMLMILMGYEAMVCIVCMYFLLYFANYLT